MKNFIYGTVACLIIATVVFVVFGINTSDMHIVILGIITGVVAVVIHTSRTYYEKHRSRFHLRKSY